MSLLNMMEVNCWHMGTCMSMISFLLKRCMHIMGAIYRYHFHSLLSRLILSVTYVFFAYMYIVLLLKMKLIRDSLFCSVDLSMNFDLTNSVFWIAELLICLHIW